MNEAGHKISARMGEARKGGPLAELAALQALEAEYTGNESALSYIRNTVAQLLLPRMGDYAGAHRYADLLDPQASALANSLEDPSALAGHAPVNAMNAIVEAAKTRQVVMINEAHHVPQHRAFTLELLGALGNDVRNRRDDVARRHCADCGHLPRTARRGGEHRVRDRGDEDQQQPADPMVPDPRDLRAGTALRRELQPPRYHQPFWSSAYARIISRTRRWRTTSPSCR